ncbi:DNA-directed RNA polymerase I subunit RPA12 [Cichlidogyrus casuarinus]|uniref:DNA-directed RNA polymerase I subunit RPA12 n=1 Tax=Cichlidogyrus casuarinus TaxID=1844966 RepID=A0ABD2PXP9_9PLAT
MTHIDEPDLFRVTDPPRGLDRSHRYFCFVCGTLLPYRLEIDDSIKCAKCGKNTYMNWFKMMKVEFTDGSLECSVDCPMESMKFYPKMLKKAKKILSAERAIKEADTDFEMNDPFKNAVDNDGPTVRKDCPYCGNDRMTYVTLQTRSADEGQTVIYTCTICKKKEVENT